MMAGCSLISLTQYYLGKSMFLMLSKVSVMHPWSSLKCAGWPLPKESITV